MIIIIVILGKTTIKYSSYKKRWFRIRNEVILEGWFRGVAMLASPDSIPGFDQIFNIVILHLRNSRDLSFP